MREKIIRFIARIIAFFKFRKQKNKNVGASIITPNNGTIIIDDKPNPLNVDLIDDNLSEKNQKKLRQYTKVFVTSLTIIACIWVTWSYILCTYALCMYGNTETLQDLSKEVIISIIAVSLGYMLKAFVETYCEKKNLDNNDENIKSDSNDYEEVG